VKNLTNLEEIVEARNLPGLQVLLFIVSNRPIAKEFLCETSWIWETDLNLYQVELTEEFAEIFEIGKVPQFIVYKNGLEIGSIIGTCEENYLRTEIDKLLQKDCCYD
jgi:hypothetical protein